MHHRWALQQAAVQERHVLTSTDQTSQGSSSSAQSSMSSTHDTVIDSAGLGLHTATLPYLAQMANKLPLLQGFLLFNLQISRHPVTCHCKHSTGHLEAVEIVPCSGMPLGTITLELQACWMHMFRCNIADKLLNGNFICWHGNP